MAPERRVSDLHKVMNPPEETFGEGVLRRMRPAEYNEQNRQAWSTRPTLPPLQTTCQPAPPTRYEDYQNSQGHHRYRPSLNGSSTNQNDGSRLSDYTTSQWTNENGYPRISSEAQGINSRSGSDNPTSCNSSRQSKDSLVWNYVHKCKTSSNALDPTSTQSSNFDANSASHGSSRSSLSSNHLPGFFQSVSRNSSPNNPINSTTASVSQSPVSTGQQSCYTSQEQRHDFAVRALADMRSGRSGANQGSNRWSDLAQGQPAPRGEDERSPTDIRGLDRHRTSQVFNPTNSLVSPTSNPQSSTRSKFEQSSYATPSLESSSCSYHPSRTLPGFSGLQSNSQSNSPLPRNPDYYGLTDPDSAIRYDPMYLRDEFSLSQRRDLQHSPTQLSYTPNPAKPSPYGYGAIQNQGQSFSSATSPEPIMRKRGVRATTELELPSTPAGTPTESNAHADIGRADRTFKCEHSNEGVCDTANNNCRKGFSDFFGRNKICTKAILPQAWIYKCRQHYQRNKYRCSKGGKQAYANHKWIYVKKQVERIEEAQGAQAFPQHGPVEWHIGYQKELATALTKAQDRAFRKQPFLIESDDAKVQTLMKQVKIAARLLHHTGDKKTKDDCIAFLDAVYRECQQEDLNDLIPAEMLPIKWGGTDYGRGTSQKKR